MYVVHDSMSSTLNDTHFIPFPPKTYLGTGAVSRLINDFRDYEETPGGPPRNALEGMSLEMYPNPLYFIDSRF